MRTALTGFFLKTDADRHFWAGMARAFGGALVFALPLLMTLEMWSLGPEITPDRLVVFLGLTVPTLVGMSHFAGFEDTFNWREDLLDAFAALAVGFVVSTAILWLLGVFRSGMPLTEILGMVALQAVACSLGAMLGVSQFGDEGERAREERRRQETDYAGSIFFMGVGALVLSFAIAPTEEVLLLANRVAGWELAVVVLVALAIMHAFVVAEVKRRELDSSGALPQWKLLVRFTVVGYAVALLLSAYILWVFGRLDGMSPDSIVASVVVLSFPAAIGAGAAHFIF